MQLIPKNLFNPTRSWIYVVLLFIILALAVILIGRCSREPRAAHIYMAVAADGTLSFPADSNGYRIPDYSHAGYKNSDVALPVFGVEYEAKVTLNSPTGDSTSRIQQAVDQVMAMPANSFGYKGAVVLGPGTWSTDQVSLRGTGVVLRGSGIGETILSDPDNKQAQCVAVGLSDVDDNPNLWDDGRSGKRWNITTAVVNVGDFSFAVDNAAGLAVGDQIIIDHPCTQAWLNSIGGGAPAPEQWPVDSVPIRYNRYITAIEGNTITVDAPIFYSLVRSRSQCFVFKWTATPTKLCGVENLTITFKNNGANSGIRFNQAENCWVRNVNVKKAKQQSFASRESSRITMDSCRADEPTGPEEGSYRYGFSGRGEQLTLIRDCSAKRMRHSFIGGGFAASGTVVLRGFSEDSYGQSEDGHQRWQTGTLFDGLIADHIGQPEGDPGEDYDSFNSFQLWIGNHGDNSNGHGWSSVSATVYKCVLKDGYAIVQKPPTGMNFEIDCSGDFRSAHSTHGDYPGALDIATTGTLPASLFEAQLAQRLDTTPPDPEPEPEPEPEPGLVLLFPEQAALAGPMVDEAGVIYTTVRDEGAAVYTFFVPIAGNYKLVVDADAPNAGSNSFWVTIDTAAKADANIWDIIELTTGGFQRREVSARGNGTFDDPEHEPAILPLAYGWHTATFYGREINTKVTNVRLESVVVPIRDRAREPAAASVDPSNE